VQNIDGEDYYFCDSEGENEEGGEEGEEGERTEGGDGEMGDDSDSLQSVDDAEGKNNSAAVASPLLALLLAPAPAPAPVQTAVQTASNRKQSRRSRKAASGKASVIAQPAAHNHPISVASKDILKEWARVNPSARYPTREQKNSLIMAANVSCTLKYHRISKEVTTSYPTTNTTTITTTTS
jgi:hypothetical protein